jgi:hypothetical protein
MTERRFPSITELLIQIVGLLVLFAAVISSHVTLQGQVAQLQRDQARIEGELAKFQEQYLRAELFRSNLDLTNERLQRLNEKVTEVKSSIRRFQ